MSRSLLHDTPRKCQRRGLHYTITPRGCRCRPRPARQRPLPGLGSAPSDSAAAPGACRVRLLKRHIMCMSLAVVQIIHAPCWYVADRPASARCTNCIHASAPQGACACSSSPGSRHAHDSTHTVSAARHDARNAAAALPPCRPCLSVQKRSPVARHAAALAQVQGSHSCLLGVVAQTGTGPLESRARPSGTTCTGLPACCPQLPHARHRTTKKKKNKGKKKKPKTRHECEAERHHRPPATTTPSSPATPSAPPHRARLPSTVSSNTQICGEKGA